MTTITIGNGNTVVNEGVLTGATLIIGNGNDSVTLLDGSTNDTIIVGNGHDTLDANGLSHSTINVGNGSATITANGDGDTIEAGNGSLTITAKGNDDVIVVGNGNDTITTGANASISIGNGIDVVVAGAHSTVGPAPGGKDNGDKQVTAGPDSSITLGNGNNLVFVGSDSTVTVGNGTAIIHAGTSDVITIGHGADLVRFDGLTPSFTVPATLTVDEEGSVALPITIGPPALGHEVINGFRPQQDVIALDTADFANYAAVQSHTAQVGLDTVITLDPSDTITLTNVDAASLSADNFQFFNGATDAVTIANVPLDATLSAGINNGNGSWTLTPAQLAGLTLNAGEPIGYPSPVDLQTTITNPAGQMASATQDTNLTVDALPPSVGVAVLPSQGNDPVTETRLNISAAPDDADNGNDNINRVVLSGIPNGVTLSHSGVPIPVIGGSATLPGSNFGGGAGGSYEVDVTTPADQSSNFNIGVTAYADEPHSPEQSASTSQNITVDYSKQSNDLSFNNAKANQSIWNSGTAFVGSFDKFFGTTVHGSAGLHVGTTISLLFTSIKLTLGASGTAYLKAGFQSDLSVNSGTFSGHLPFNVSVGETYNKTTNRLEVDPTDTELAGGGFSTIGPNGSYSLDFIFEAMANATLSALGHSTHVGTHFGTTIPLISFNSSTLKTTIGLPDNLGSATFQWPTVNVSATGGAGTITGSSTSNPIFQLNLDPIAAITDILLGTDPFKGGLSLGVAGVSYTLLAATVAPGVNVKQTFSLNNLGLTPTLTSENGTSLPISFGTPEIFSNASSLDANNNGTISLNVGLTPEATLSNDTSLGGQLVLGLRALEAQATAFGLSTTLGPLINPKTTLHLGSLFTLYKNTFPVAFQSQSVTANIS